MKTKLFIIFLLSIVEVFPVYAQDSELQKFVGVWTPSKTGGIIGNI